MFSFFYQEVKDDLENSLLPFLFPNTELAGLIAQAETPSPWTFFNAYYASWWWNRFSFRSGIQSQDALSYFDNVLNSLSYLKQVGMLNVERVNIVANYGNHREMLSILFHLHQAKLLRPEFFYLALAENNPLDMVNIILKLAQTNILTPNDFGLIATHANCHACIRALYFLQKAGVLTHDNFLLVLNHPNPEFIAHSLSYLQASRILTQNSFILVMAQNNRYVLRIALFELMLARILTEENFAALVAINHVALVSEQAVGLIWDRIPFFLLTQTAFQRLLTASEHANPMAELERVREQIIEDIIQADAEHAAFNPGQSTHTASVHQSVSAAAAKLMRSYGHDFNLEITIQEIKAYVNSLDDSLQHQAAKRCIARITAIDYAYTDTSGVSTRQLLALAYIAIHHDTKRLGSLADAKALFVEGLYEIQRGYNLNAQGHDQGGQDAPICSAGTFNKLMEKLNGIHQDVEVNYINHEGAASKFIKLAQAHALTYLQSLTSPLTAEEYCRVKDLLESIKTDTSLKLIWDKIKPSVEVELWDEFKAAYGGPTDVRFLGLMDYGHQIGAPDLSALETRLLVSPGYRAYMNEQERLSLREQPLLLSLERNRLWSQRHQSFVRQNEFDKQYGLVIPSNKD